MDQPYESLITEYDRSDLVQVPDPGPQDILKFLPLSSWDEALKFHLREPVWPICRLETTQKRTKTPSHSQYQSSDI